jgi:hypothetical protein
MEVPGEQFFAYPENLDLLYWYVKAHPDNFGPVTDPVL